MDLDRPQGFFNVVSHVDNDVVGGYMTAQLRVSYITFQVRSNGVLSIGATGYHVRGDAVHRKVDEEILELKAAVEERLRTIAANR
jgi:hypothetical protein